MGIDAILGQKPKDYKTGDASLVARCLTNVFKNAGNDPKLQAALKLRQEQALRSGNIEVFNLCSSINYAIETQKEGKKFDSNNLYPNYGVSPV